MFHQSIVDAHKGSIYNRDILRDSSLCGCFFCLDQFDYKNIYDWIDGDNTALCPSCGIDSVIGSASGYPITDGFLKEMKQFWF
ncbi:cytoplasmic protein [Acinetobacter puyangensis]|uniref:cytoplasmic protein n=1 Tax=Acinetobacter puyangensis TaxID=1096779 RepID=UPI003A4D3879